MNHAPPAAASRHVLDAVLSLQECHELVFIQRCTSVVGYRAHVRSSTIHDIAATEPVLLIPLVRFGAEDMYLYRNTPSRAFLDDAAVAHKQPNAAMSATARAKRVICAQVRARERVQEAVEDALGLPGGLLVEFTALMTWRPGASIGWHYDANRCRRRLLHSWCSRVA